MADEFRYRPVVPVSKVKMLDDAVYGKCDVRDGLKDDVITNPPGLPVQSHDRSAPVQGRRRQA